MPLRHNEGHFHYFLNFLLLILAERATSVEARCTAMCAAFRLKQQVWHKHHTALRAAADRLARIYADVGEHYTFIHACLQIF